MQPVCLTKDAISLLSSGENSATIKPVLQVVDVRMVNQNSNSERYRLLLSDGVFSQQGMLATQRNDLVRSQKLQNGSIILLTDFVCNVIQNRMIIIIVDLDVKVEKCDLIGDPKPFPFKNDGTGSSMPRPQAATQATHAVGSGNAPTYGANSAVSGSVTMPTFSGNHDTPSGEDRNAQSQGASFSRNMDSVRSNPSSRYLPKTEFGEGAGRASGSNYARPPQSMHHQPMPAYVNRGPVAKNLSAPRIIPIAALNPYQGRWTIKARVTTKGELRHFNNPRGEGKVFSFDLLDSEGGEIRVTSFNAVADQFYNQIEPGVVYMISQGTLRPAQKAFNHLNNDYEIMLENTSTVQRCLEEDASIPKQQFHFRSISDIQNMENNAVVDMIGIVSSIAPASSIMRKNGTETQKRSLHLKDISGRSVELTMWGNFCHAEGQTLQDMCDSGTFPVLAVKSARVSDFNGKSVGTLSSSQFFIDPDFPEAKKLKLWFENEGRNTPAISISSSRDTNTARADAWKTISQIKEEKLGTSEKPDWISVFATLTFIKMDNFCYTACPVMIGERQCQKKVINNGDGKWRCERCDRLVDECDYRYILQMQIQDHTGLTWVTAFQETGEEIMGISAKDMYHLKHEEQDDDKFAELVRGALFSKFLFKLRVKEEVFSDEQRVKSTVVKAEKVNLKSYTKYLLDQTGKDKENIPSKSMMSFPTWGTDINSGESAATAMNHNASSGQAGSYSSISHGDTGNPSTGSRGTYPSCSNCGGTGHNNANCPRPGYAPPQSYGTGSTNIRAAPASNSAFGSSAECFKCHEIGHMARDCPNTSSNPASSLECYKCHKTGHMARDCPLLTNIPPAYGSTSGRYGMHSKQHVGGGF